MGKPIPPMVRFMRHVTEVDGHWMWGSTKAGGGPSKRPTFQASTRKEDGKVYAHRWIYEQVVGAIPDGYEVDHVCKVGMCVNPDHLEAVTHAENLRRERMAICKNGHTMTEENRRIEGGYSRGCKTCSRDRAREYYRNKVRAAGREPDKRV